MVERLVNKIRHNVDEIIMVEEHDPADAEVDRRFLRHLGASRRCRRSRRRAREGINVGLLKLITVWPFPEQAIRELAGSACRCWSFPRSTTARWPWRWSAARPAQARRPSWCRTRAATIHIPRMILNAIHEGAAGR